ncbi:MAG: hypothetical protein ACOX3P_00830 [Saccharofermentanales bacterium]|jgi:DNA polymerase-3 subunit epsilon|nr:hypothetical protein [Bacillota bacterium]
MKYLALDFETANEHQSSICSVGYALFDNEKIVSSGSYLVKPEPFYFNEVNVAINGITRLMTVNSPPYCEIRNNLINLDFDYYVCHNASFDMNCLTKIAKLQNFKAVEVPVLCTMIMASRVLNSGFISLDRLCRFTGIALNHHNAEADAIACGHLLNYMLTNSGYELSDFLEEFCIIPGAISDNTFTDLCYEKSRKSYNYQYAPSVKDMNLDICEPLNSALAGLQFAYTGDMEIMTRAEAMIEVHRRGGINKNSVTLKTNYLVVANTAFEEAEEGIFSSKFKKAIDLKESGKSNIAIITENDFINILGCK